MNPVSDPALDQIFRNARTTSAFADRPVTDATLQAVVSLAALGPTAFNQQPIRLLFLRSPEAKARLAPALSRGNHDKTLAAPVTAIVAWDMAFPDHLPTVWPAADVRGFYTDEGKRRESARRNGTLQAGYLVLAARALGLACGPMSGFDGAMVQAEFLDRLGWEVNFLLNLGWPLDPGAEPPASPRLPRLSFAQIAQVL